MHVSRPIPLPVFRPCYCLFLLHILNLGPRSSSCYPLLNFHFLCTYTCLCLSYLCFLLPRLPYPPTKPHTSRNASKLTVTTTLSQSRLRPFHDYTPQTHAFSSVSRLWSLSGMVYSYLRIAFKSRLCSLYERLFFTLSVSILFSFSCWPPPFESLPTHLSGIKGPPMFSLLPHFCLDESVCRM